MDIKREPVDENLPVNEQETDEHWFEVPVIKSEETSNFEEITVSITNIKSEVESEWSSKEEEPFDTSISIIKREKSVDGGQCSYSAINQLSTNTETASVKLPLKCSTQLSSKHVLNELSLKTDILTHKMVAVIALQSGGVFNKRNFVCSVCMEIFPNTNSLKNHAIVHESGLDVAEPKAVKFNFEPTRSYNTKTSIIKRNYRKIFKCEHCEKTLSSKANLEKHRTSHKGNFHLKCDQCDYICVLPADLILHIKTHTSEKPVKCSQCDFKCVKSTQLKSHIKKTHPDEKPFKCDKCDYKTAEVSNLKKHEKIHTGEKQFKCGLCDYKCVLSAYLKSHLKKHSGEKPLNCDRCSFKTAHRYVLKRHQLIHAKEKN